MSKRVIFIHRWAGGPNDDWRPWLKSELEKRGWEVIAPEMPDTEVPIIEKWVNKINEVIGSPDSDTYFVGHSIGNQAIIRYLETIDSPIGGAIFVAGWFNLENMEDEETIEIAKPWIETPVDSEKIKSVLPRSVLLISDNDPYGAFEENTTKFGELGSKVIVLPQAGHVTVSKEPAILEQFLKLAGE